MKKILAFLLAATLLCAMFVLPSSAAAVNTALDAEYNKAAPDIDGVVEEGEYGYYPALTYSEDTEEFTHDDDHDDYNDWDFDFYITWNEEYLSMAWVVESDVHGAFPKQDYDADGDIDEIDYNYMWEYSCVQFIITPSTPEAGVTGFQQGDYIGNYLEVGLSLLDDGDIARAAWCYPTGVSKEDISINDWDAAIVRDESAKTTTYEVSIPWNMSGVAAPAKGSSFGLSFAVAAQEHYTNVRKGMIEWNDALLGGKKADNAGVITLYADDTVDVSSMTGTGNVLPNGEAPAEAEGKTQFPLHALNKALGAEQNALQLDPEKPINSNWAYALLLQPVEDKENTYSVVAGFQGVGDEVTFDGLYEDGMAILAVHSDGGENLARKDIAATLPVGSELVLWGVNVEEQALVYGNAMAYVISTPEVPGNSSDVSDETSAEAPSEAPSEAPEADASDASDASDAAEEDDNTTLWIIIAVVGVAVVAVVVVVVLKKKK